jgi:hypothetical protein
MAGGPGNELLLAESEGAASGTIDRVRAMATPGDVVVFRRQGLLGRRLVPHVRVPFRDLPDDHR